MWSDLMGLFVLRPREKKTPCFMDRRTCQVGSVGRLFVCLFSWFSFFLVAKMTLKTHKIFFLNLTFFTKNIWENILTYFYKFSSKILRFWSENGWFCKIFEKLKKKICQNGKFSRSCPWNRIFFFMALSQVILQVIRVWMHRLGLTKKDTYFVFS